MEMPTYFLFRDIPPGEPFDPTSPPQFFPPKDSDELFDALRAKYPHVKTHSERMRDAIIEFLLEERDSELRAKTHSPAIPATTATTSPWQQSWPSMSSASEPSLFSSPDLFDLATPSFDASPSADMVPPMPARCPSEASPPALEDMTGVFSLSSAQQQPKQKTRRKMTEAEKVEYRKRRIVKACDKCSKRKRKCHHNQPEMETLPTKKAGKVTKPRTNAQKQPSPPSAFTSMSTSATPMTESLDETCDYGYVLGEPMADCDFDHFINFDDSTFGQQLYEPEFPETVPAAKSWYCDSGNTFMASLKDFPRASTQSDQRRTEGESVSWTTIPDHAQHTANISNIDGQQARSGAVPNIARIGPCDGETGTRGLDVPPPSRSGTHYYRRPWQEANGGGDQESTHARPEESTSRQAATHNLHVHCAECEDSYIVHNSREVSGRTRPPPTKLLSHIVLRLVTTTRAVRAFARLRNSTSRSCVSMANVTNAIGVASLNSRLRATGSLPNLANQWQQRQQGGDYSQEHYHTDGARESDRSRARRNGRLHSAHLGAFEGLGRESANANGALTSLSVSNRASDWSASRRSERVCTTSRSTCENSAPTIAREGKPPLSSNRGIDSAPSPSSELSMLRRRIPRRQSLGANRRGTIGIFDDPIWRAPADATLRNACSATLAQRQRHLATHHTTNNDTYERPDNSSSPSTAPPNLATRLDFSTRHDAAGRNASGASSNPTTSSQTTSHLYRAAQTPRRRPRPLDNQNPSHNNTLLPPNESKLSDHVRYRDHHGRDAHLQLLSEGTTSAGAKSTQPNEAWRFGLVALACFLAAGSSLVSALLAGLGLELVASSSLSTLRECWKFNRRGSIRGVEGLGKKMLLG